MSPEHRLKTSPDLLHRFKSSKVSLLDITCQGLGCDTFWAVSKCIRVTHQGFTHHIPIDASFLQQLRVIALLKHVALAKDIDDVCVLDRRQPVCHRHGGPADGHLLDGRRDGLLRLRVEAACCLVQEEDLWVADQRAGDGQSLLLAAA